MPTSGNDTLFGTPGPDTIDGLAGDDRIDGLAGNDSLVGSAGSDTILGGDGDDTINPLGGDASNDVISTGPGRDTISLNFTNSFGSLTITDFRPYDDVVLMNKSNTNGIVTTVGVDADLDGLADDTVITFALGTIRLLDFIPCDYLGSGADDVISAPFYGGAVYGLAGNDSLSGTQGSGRFFGGDGDDTIRAANGSTTIDGGAGNDSLSDNSGNDVLIGGPGDDTIYQRHGVDTINGGDGNDWINAAIDLALGLEGPTIVAGSGNDVIDLVGSKGSVDAGAGDDLVRLFYFAAPNGLAYLEGGSGQDTLNAATANITSNRATYVSATKILGMLGPQYYFVSGFEQIDFTPNADTVSGWEPGVAYALGDGNDWFADYSPSGAAAAHDSVSGGAGNDALYGLAGNDSLDGGAGVDLLIGGDGADTLIGGAGGDWMGGGAGADVFRYLAVSDSNAAQGFDAVAQFEASLDRIDLAAIDANTGAAGDQAFTIGALAAGQAGRLQITTTAGYTLVEGDVNGDGVADIAFFVWSETGGVAAPATLSAGDFVL
jgi:Ca2+-binding RTX toxin-like protein